MSAGQRFAIVAIGRNEGERLRKCLESVAQKAALVVYVDSGSTDGSAAMAQALGVAIVELDMAIPPTAARARNAGFDHVRRLAPHLPYVQFVDGDCEVVGNWLECAAAFLDAHPEVAAVCGLRRERHPERSVYNLICDIEWNAAAGRAQACGGDVMMRVEALAAAGGYRANLIAGEDPEVCVRLRLAGWQVWRLDEEMTLHDAAITRFGQWWKRAMRTGYAFAEGAALHGATPERYSVRESRRAWFWGLGVPLLALICTVLFGPAGIAILAAYPLQVARLARRGGRSARHNWLHAGFLVLGKFPEMLGQASYLTRRLFRREPTLIEYK